MEDIKNLFKKTIIVTIVCFLLGLVFQNKYLLFGISGGCAISVIALYMLSVDTKAIKDCQKDSLYRLCKKIFFTFYIFSSIIIFF